MKLLTRALGALKALFGVLSMATVVFAIACSGDSVALAKLEKHLIKAKEGASAESPCAVRLKSVNLTDNWGAINVAVQNAGKYVVLDLSECTATANAIKGSIEPAGNDVNIIGDNQYLRGLILPSALESIGDSAFAGCQWLGTVDLGASVSSIASTAFRACRGLASINVHADNVHYTSVDGVLYNKDLSSLISYPGGKADISFTVPDTVTSIGAYAFDRAATLQRLVVPDTLSLIGASAFSGSPLTSVKFGTNFANSRGFVYVLSGTFNMGSKNGDNDERPVHSVSLTRDFWMSDHEVTQAEWLSVMGTSVRQQKNKVNSYWPLNGEGADYPMYYISWNEAVDYCNKLSELEGRTPAYNTVDGTLVTWDKNADGYRLPTEAEWEYAARGGRLSEGYTYSGSDAIDTVAWYDSNSRYNNHAVKTKAPNELGIYDMSGNVWEWCWDWYGPYKGTDESDPEGSSAGPYRVIHGGASLSTAWLARPSYRINRSPPRRFSDLGFRVVHF